MTNITSSGLNTIVSPPGCTTCNITGGTLRGNNLFHSFGRFDVGRTGLVNDVANFVNDVGLPTNNSNIIGRVTEPFASQIFGTLQTTGFGSAALWLINPAGVVFGPTAQLNVGGSVNISTADYIKLSDGFKFNAIGPIDPAVLTSAPVTAFGFLSSNPQAITVQGLTVSTGGEVFLVGGNVNVTGGTFTAPGGKINLASAASAGEVELTPSFQLASGTQGGTVSLSGGAVVTVSDDGAGTVVIRGGTLVMADATISADTINTPGASVAVDINVSGDVTLSNPLGAPAITARSTGSGDAGQVQILSGNLTATLTGSSPLIDTHGSDAGKAGNVSITTGNLQVTGQPVGNFFFIDSGTRGAGNGGDVTIAAQSALLQDATITTGDFPAFTGTGFAGTVMLSADTLELIHSNIFASSFSARGGDITISSNDITMTNSQIGAGGLDAGGTIAISGSRFIADFSAIETFTALSPGGGITVTSNVIELTNGSTLVSSTFGDGAAGDIRVTANDHVGLLGNFGGQRPSGIFSNSFGDAGLGNLGNSGAIVVTTPLLQMTGGARINSSTQSNGRGGDVTITANNSISISGELPTGDPEPLFGLGSIHPSGIFTQTVDNGFCTGACGDAGRVSISTGTLSMGSGARIDSGTSSAGLGGNITVNSAGTLSISGTLSDGTASGIFSRTIGTAPGSGTGGTISLQANQVQLSNGASVSASSTGVADAGNIAITANQLNLFDSSITTQAALASGGNVTIIAGELVRLNNSQINTSVAGGPTTAGGDILIDPPFVVLQNNSHIFAQAFAGLGGNITIVASGLFIDPSSSISASSQLGISGSVNVQSPVFFLSGTLVPLPKNPVQAASLLQARCAARMQGSGASNFVQRGRDGLPPEPGGWLTSPMPVAGSPSNSQIGRDEPSVGADVMLAQAEFESAPMLGATSNEGPLTRIASANGTGGCGLDLVLAQ